MNFRKNRLAVLTVKLCCIPVAPYNHPEVEKQEMLLRHGAQDFLKRVAQTKVCSATGVLSWGNFSFNTAGEKSFLHLGSL